MRFDGDRRFALALEMGPTESARDFAASARTAMTRAEKEGAALVYGFAPADRRGVFEELGWSSLGPVPLLTRPLRLAAAPLASALPRAVRVQLPSTALVLPFGRGRQPGFREVTARDPRLTRLWDRFSIDVPVAVERNANWVNPRVFDREGAGYRVFVFEDGDRYVIRALCIFRVSESPEGVVGHVVELLHDRSVAGMRAASHLLGIAVREMSDAGATMARAWSFVHSGSFPIFARHAFLPARERIQALEMGVRAFDPNLEWVVSQRHHWYVSELDTDRV
jgi:hypothetical protein